MKKKYLYNGQIIEQDDVEQGAKQSNMDINSYIQKAGMKPIDDNYSYQGKDVSAEDILTAANQSKLGFDDYIQKAGFQKKSQDGNGLEVGADGQLKQSSPITSESHSPDEVDVKALADQNKAANPNASEFDSFNKIDLANEAANLVKPTDESEAGLSLTGATPQIDQSKLDRAKSITDYLTKNGENPKELSRLFGDIPEEAYDVTNINGEKTQTKDILYNQYKANPIDTENKINNIKTQFALQNAAYNHAKELGYNEHDAQQIGINIGNTFSINQGTQHNFLNEYYKKIQDQQDLINKNLDGDAKTEAQQRLQETSAPNINAANPQLVEQYNLSPIKDLVSPDEYAGLETERLFNPQKYQTDLNILQSKPDAVSNAKPTDISGAAQQQIGINEQIGKESIHRQLLDIGRNNAFTKLTADQYNLNEAYKNAQTPEQQEQISNQYFANQQKINGLKTDAQADDARFPLTANLKFDNQIKELTGQPGFGMVEYGAKRFGQGFVNTANTAEDLLTSVFGSDEANAKLQAERIGQTQKTQTENYLPSNLSGSDYSIKASKDLKAQADAILKGRDVEDLAPQEKQNLFDLIGRNEGDLTTISADKSKNSTAKIIGYKVAGFTGDITSFIAQTAALGGMGMSAKAAELTTLFNTTYSDAYNEATEKGMSPSLANQYALLHGGVMALAGAVSSKYDAVKGILGDSKSALGKEIAGIGEEGWNAIVNDKLPYLKKIAQSAKSVIGENAKMIATYGVGTSIVNDLANKGVFNQPISNDEIIDHALQSAKDMAIGSMALAGAGFFMHLAKEPVTLKDKAMFWENGTNPDIGKARIDEALANNQITQEQGNLRKKAIDNMANIIQKVPTKNDRGKDMTDAERIEYGYNLFLKDKAKEVVADLPPKQSEDAEFSGLVAEHKNQILLSQPTDKQLQSQKTKLEKALIPEKDELGKNIEIPPKELMQTKAELEAVNDAIKNKTSDKIQNTTQELQDANRSDVINLIGKFRPDKEANWGYEDLAKAYHEAKDNNSNPELVSGVDKVIGGNGDIENKIADIEKRRKQDLANNEKVSELNPALTGENEFAKEINDKYDKELADLNKKSEYIPFEELPKEKSTNKEVIPEEHPEIKKLMDERDEKIKEVSKPEITFEKIKNEDLLKNPDKAIENKNRYKEIIKNYKVLKDLVECL